MTDPTGRTEKPDPIEREARAIYLRERVADELRRGLRASGLTMDEVQRIAELDAEVVRGIFAGTENFKLRDLAAIIDALGTISTFELTPASATSAHQRIEKQRRIEEIKRAIRWRTPE